MILESGQALSKASSFVCGDDLRDSAVATVMFKKWALSHTSRLQDQEYLDMLFGRVLQVWFCAHTSIVYVFLQQFLRRFRIFISFSVSKHFERRN